MITSNDTAAAPGSIDILVVDDVAENLTAMRALLTRPGLTVLTAASAADALELLLKHEVALALLDVQMPQIDGFALAELMRGAERTRSVPIIFLTAAPLERGRSFRGYEAGAVDFLFKPIEPRIIESKVAVFVELFEQRRALAARNAELERALSLNETMTAVLTHDLRSPLAAIATSAEVVRRAANDERMSKAASYIKSSSSRMARMIEQLLDFSHIRSGALQLQRQRADLQSVCAVVVDEIRLAHPGAQVDLRCEGDLSGEFDPDRMMQILTNLLGNALQHGQGDAAVLVHLTGTPGELIGEVSNQGALPADVAANLFVPFRGNHTSRHEGLGLGLYIVEQFVRAHGGQVSGRTDGRQTVFTFEVPRRRT